MSEKFPSVRMTTIWTTLPYFCTHWWIHIIGYHPTSFVMTIFTSSVWALSIVYVLRYKHLQNFVRSNKIIECCFNILSEPKAYPILMAQNHQWTTSQIRRFDLVAILVDALITLRVRYDIYYTERSEWGKNNVMSVELLSTGLAFCVP